MVKKKQTASSIATILRPAPVWDDAEGFGERTENQEAEYAGEHEVEEDESYEISSAFFAGAGTGCGSPLGLTV
jgi:hypothetical protein